MVVRLNTNIVTGKMLESENKNMGKKTIRNRKNQKIVVLVEEAKSQKGLAFVMHGLGGFKEQPHIRTMAEAFKENGYTAIRFDTTNALGESDGRCEEATATNYYEDLEDVINWAELQKWYQEPFVLVGHSLGGMSIALFAENYPDRVKALAPISTSVSGKLSIEARDGHNPEQFKEWQRTGWLEEESHSKPGVIKRLKWSYVADLLKHDLLPKVGQLIMPVLMIVGENDTSAPPRHQHILYQVLPGKKELHIIKGAPHTFRDPKHLAEVKQIFSKWMGSLR